MANLAIKGHATRGKEVIEILEMLGGKNRYHFKGDEDEWFVLNGGIQRSDRLFNEKGFALEEFLEKFPYKVGDKVIYTSEVFTIIGMKWDCSRDIVIYTMKNNCSIIDCYDSTWIKPYNEETMKDYLVTEEDYGKTLEVEQEYIDAAERLMDQLAESTHWKCKDFDSQKMLALFLKKNTSIITEKEDSIIVDIPKGYEFAGVDGDNHQVVFEKVKSKYPKTYRECAEIVGFNIEEEPTIFGYKEELLDRFQKLLICRDAYWKIAGEQMGLDKPWAPDFTNDKPKYCIYVDENVIECDMVVCINTLLSFPTAEMRDAFYENFKDLIEQCKELL